MKFKDNFCWTRNYGAVGPHLPSEFRRDPMSRQNRPCIGRNKARGPIRFAQDRPL